MCSRGVKGFFAKRDTYGQTFLQDAKATVARENRIPKGHQGPKWEAITGDQKLFQ